MADLKVGGIQGARSTSWRADHGAVGLANTERPEVAALPRGSGNTEGTEKRKSERPMLVEPEVTSGILRAAIAVHRSLGPGFLEKLYERALLVELIRAGHRVEQQKRIVVRYEGHELGRHQLDLVVDEKVIVELKTATRITSRHAAIVRSYLKASRLPIALILNFALPQLGIKRIIHH